MTESSSNGERRRLQIHVGRDHRSLNCGAHHRVLVTCGSTQHVVLNRHSSQPAQKRSQRGESTQESRRPIAGMEIDRRQLEVLDNANPRKEQILGTWNRAQFAYVVVSAKIVTEGGERQRKCVHTPPKTAGIGVYGDGGPCGET